jgi:hypothetical protein
LWKKENTIKSTKCFNIEHIINAEENGLVAPDSLTVEEYVAQALAEGAVLYSLLGFVFQINLDSICQPTCH